jgi:hypothetical protein
MVSHIILLFRVGYIISTRQTLPHIHPCAAAGINDILRHIIDQMLVLLIRGEPPTGVWSFTSAKQSGVRSNTTFN